MNFNISPALQDITGSAWTHCDLKSFHALLHPCPGHLGRLGVLLCLLTAVGGRGVCACLSSAVGKNQWDRWWEGHVLLWHVTKGPHTSWSAEVSRPSTGWERQLSLPRATPTHRVATPHSSKSRPQSSPPTPSSVCGGKPLPPGEPYSQYEVPVWTGIVRFIGNRPLPSDPSPTEFFTKPVNLVRIR